MVTQLRASTPVARKAHRCGMCNGAVQPGERYHRSTNLFDDRVYDFITCSPCESDRILAEVYAWCGSPWEGVSAEDADEWAHDNRDQPAAAAWLTRNGCRCEDCDPTGALAVDDFNRANPIGTAVNYWPGARSGAPLASVTRSEAWLLGDHTPVVMVEGYAGGIALTHVLTIGGAR